MKRMLIDANHEEETRVAIVDRKQILEFDYASANKKQIKGNIYLAKVTRVEPSLQAAFVEYGGGRQGFLPFSEIHPDYYQIPTSDKQKLMEEVERELQEDAEEEEAELEQRQNRGRRRRVRSRRRNKNKDEQSSDSDDDNVEEVHEDEISDTSNIHVSDADETPGNEQDDPGTKYAKKEDPSVSSEVVDGADDAVETSGEEESDEKKKPRRRMRIRGRSRRKKDDEQETVEENNEANAEEKKSEIKAEKSKVQTETAVQEDKFSIQPPIGTQLGAALFSEDKPFEATKENGEDVADEDEEDIETIDSEEEAVLPKRKKRVPFFKRYKIQEVIKRGQVVLVQATKEERGNKGASVTTYLSLAGRYCVLMPNSPRDGGVSRKISDIETRKRLKEVMSQLTLAQGMSVIIRTAGIDRNRTEIRRDFDYLVKLWNQIREGTLSATAPALIYEENNLIKRAIRDLYTSDIEEVLVEGEEGYKESREFMKMLMPSHAGRVKQYEEDMPLYYAYGIEEQLTSMHDPVVKLKSGGYLVINPTEALISIDVNSGKSTGERNIEETAVKTNIEAAHEVARQLRLRDLAGLIVIDFIDMMDSRNRRAVERNLKDALRSDRAKIQVGRISPFGLMEMSRQRLRPSIGETMHTTCPSCNGRGLVHAPESLALHIVRTLEKESVGGRWSELKLKVSQQVALYLLNSNRTLITNIEASHDVSIMIEIDHALSLSEFSIEKVRGPRSSSKKHDEQTEDNSRSKRSRGGRGRRGRRGRDEDDLEDVAANDSSSKDIEENTESEKPHKRSGRKREETTEEPSADAEELPEFTKREAIEKKKEVPKEDKVVPMQQAVSHEPPPDTSRPEGAPARKGWWQQMIELD